MTAPKFRGLLSLDIDVPGGRTGEALLSCAKLLNGMIGDAPVYWTMQGEGLMVLEADDYDLLVAYREALFSLTRHVLDTQWATLAVPQLHMLRDFEDPLELVKFVADIYSCIFARKSA